ncbi:lysozyme inhibitor LprI family protein [Sphingosinicella sp. YJ22]|uniref:lysozyme inhibitor LprI family protein n=1 Tax=Sphingosinicella sp. YJ22 TaxID=1104780 RepID=UPI001407BD71|nr:lysozyme inhibitor LprI family protein [Sphingosinicella sp. YJ22]
MKKLTAIVAVLFAFGLGGCGTQAVECGSEDAIATVKPIFQEEVQRLITEQSRNAEGGRFASNAEVRAAVRQADVTLADVRTTNRDPNSTRRFCTGMLQVTLPADLVENSDRTRRMIDENDDVNALADRNNIDRNVNRFEAEIEYSVQPTDDGRSVHAEVQEASNVFGFFAELLISHLASGEVREARAAEENAMADQRRQEEQLAQEQESALAEQRQASLEQVRAELRLAEQTINAVWGAIPSDRRQSILEMQRAWIRRKNADCRVEAASASIEPSEREIARMRCETRMNQERSNQLRQYVSYGDDGA